MNPNLSLLGALPPPDAVHRDKYPLGAAGASIPVGPMVAGMFWHESFWEPVRKTDGTWWIGLDPRNLGPAQGGHAICLVPEGWDDIRNGWDWYNQGQTSMCVAYATCRMQALHNRRQGYWPPPLYARCKQLDGFAGEGTYIRTGMDVARKEGIWSRALVGSRVTGPSLAHGILANRWATSVDDVLAALDAQGTGRIGFLNSWGRSYPRLTYIPAETVATMFGVAADRYFEATMVTDRPGPR